MRASVGRQFTAIAVFLASSLHAQIPTGAVQGNVTDPASAAVQGAEVTLQNEQTGIHRVATTNEQGLYTFSYLDSGSYRITVKATGFQTAAYPGVAVQVGQRVRVDVPLVIGEYPLETCRRNSSPTEQRSPLPTTRRKISTEASPSAATPSEFLLCGQSCALFA